MRQLFSLATLAVLFMFTSTELLLAQDRFVEVIGEASINVAADSYEIRATISGTGDTAKASTKDFEESKGKFKSIVNSMNFPGAKIEFLRPNLVNGTMMQQMGMVEMLVEEGAMPPKKFSTQEIVVISIRPEDNDPKTALKAISKVVDSVVSADAKIGQSVQEMMYNGQMPGPIAKPKRTDTKSLEKQIVKNAMEDAKRHARNLAELAGSELGQVISIQFAEEVPSELELYGYQFADEKPTLEIKRRLVVRFELVNPK